MGRTVELLLPLPLLSLRPQCSYEMVYKVSMKLFCMVFLLFKLPGFRGEETNTKTHYSEVDF